MGGAEPVDRRHIKSDLQAPPRPALHPLSLSAVTHPHLCSTGQETQVPLTLTGKVDQEHITKLSPELLPPPTWVGTPELSQ